MDGEKTLEEKEKELFDKIAEWKKKKEAEL